MSRTIYKFLVKTKTVFFIATVLSLASFNSNVIAANSAYKNVSDYSAYVILKSGTLNVRKSPGGQVVSSVRKGTHVRVLAHSGKWRQVYFNNRVQGWVFGSYLLSTASLSKLSSSQLNNIIRQVGGGLTTIARKQ